MHSISVWFSYTSQGMCKQHLESLLFSIISCPQIPTSVLKTDVRMERHVSILKEVISASVNLALMESSVHMASCALLVS